MIGRYLLLEDKLTGEYAKDPVARLLKLCEVQEKNLIDYARGDREVDGYDL